MAAAAQEKSSRETSEKVGGAFVGGAMIAVKGRSGVRGSMSRPAFPPNLCECAGKSSGEHTKKREFRGSTPFPGCNARRPRRAQASVGSRQMESARPLCSPKLACPRSRTSSPMGCPFVRRGRQTITPGIRVGECSPEPDADGCVDRSASARHGHIRLWVG